MLSREDAERKMAEFNSRLQELLQKNPSLQPDSPEIVALVKEFNDKGVPIQIVNRQDMMKAAMSMMDLLSQMGLSMPQDNIHSSRDVESLGQNLDPCKYHKKGLDTTNRTEDISKKEVDDLAIDINTMTDEQIWNKYFGKKG